MISERGQVLPLALVLIMVTAMMWIMLLNVGVLIKTRIQMQTAADTAVLTASAYRARALNMVGLTNSWLGIPVLGIGIPKGAWWMAPPHPRGPKVIKDQIQKVIDGLKAAAQVCSGDRSDLINKAIKILTGALDGVLGYAGVSYDTHDEYAKAQERFVKSVMLLQTKIILQPYGGGKAKHQARWVAKMQGADDIYTPPGSFKLGLKRNYGPIWYLSTLHLWPPMYAFPIPLPYLPANSKPDKAVGRWYMQSPQFHQKAMRLYAYRLAGSKLNRSFPLGRNLFNISAPDLYAVSEARVYNLDGPMFPKDSNNNDLFAGIPAMTEYHNASSGWKPQLIPVGGPIEH